MTFNYEHIKFRTIRAPIKRCRDSCIYKFYTKSRRAFARTHNFCGNRKMKGRVLNSNCLMARKQAFHFPCELFRNLLYCVRKRRATRLLFAQLVYPNYYKNARTQSRVWRVWSMLYEEVFVFSYLSAVIIKSIIKGSGC